MSLRSCAMSLQQVAASAEDMEEEEEEEEEIAEEEEEEEEEDPEEEEIAEEEEEKEEEEEDEEEEEPEEEEDPEEELEEEEEEIVVEAEGRGKEEVGAGEVKEVEEQVAEKAGASSSVPILLQSVSNLQSLHGALSEFVVQWSGLQDTLDFIRASIDARAKVLDARHGPLPILEVEEKKVVVAAKDKDKDKGKAWEEEPSSHGHGHGHGPTHFQDLDFICETMQSKALCKYVTAHLSDMDRLRKDVSASLRCAPNLAKLVLESMGRFYLQGSRAYDRADSPLIARRNACILLLELYILSGSCSSQLEHTIKEEAREAATAWRCRLVSEGGVESASAVDALGLLLLVASFGIPSEFTFSDLFHLLQLSNPQAKLHVLRLSPILLDKLPGIIKTAIAKDKYLEAVDLVCTFGLAEEFPPLPLLSSFCHKSMQIATEERSEGQHSVGLVLGNLKSVVKRLEDHKLDPSLLAGLNIFKAIDKLERKISKRERKQQNMNPNRMGKEDGPCRTQERHAKRKRRWLTPRRGSQGSGGGGYLPQNMLHGGFRGPLPGVGMELAAGNVHGHGPSGQGQNLYLPPVSSGGLGANLYQSADPVLRHGYTGKGKGAAAAPTSINLVPAYHHSSYPS